MKLRGKYNFQENISFKAVPVKYVESIIKNIFLKKSGWRGNTFRYS